MTRNCLPYSFMRKIAQNLSSSSIDKHICLFVEVRRDDTEGDKTVHQLALYESQIVTPSMGSIDTFSSPCSSSWEPGPYR